MLEIKKILSFIFEGYDLHHEPPTANYWKLRLRFAILADTLMSAPRSKLPVNVAKRPYRSLRVQKTTLTYNNSRYPN